MANVAAESLRARIVKEMAVAQDEASSVVFGIPESAIEIGAATRIMALSGIPLWILSHSESAKHAESSW